MPSAFGNSRKVDGMRILSALRRAAFLACITGVGAQLAMWGQAQAREPASPSVLTGNLLDVSGQGAHYLKNVGDADRMDRVYFRHFTGRTPARTVLQPAAATTPVPGAGRKSRVHEPWRSALPLEEISIIAVK
jgi:enamine deaminase RidA (YjgF/YER057c/UK114 family)